VTEPITCPRCRRAFGGEQAYRRGHRRQGRPRRETCRRVAEIRRDDRMRLGEDGVWHMRASIEPGQLKLPLFGRGRPRKAVPIYSVGTRNRRKYLVRPMPPKRPVVTILDEEAAA
jgi:hypothetical protein